MTVNLNVKDRLVVIALLPANGKLTEMVDVMDLVKKIKFSEEERKDIEYNEKDGKIQWNLDKDTGRDFDISIDQIKIIQNSIKKLDEEGKIDLYLLDTCLKFSKL